MSKQNDLIKSISYNQEEILEWIIKLYCPDGFDLDPTYSKGNFYKSGRIPQPKYKSDIKPQANEVIQADCRELTFNKDSLQAIIFDPPFLATKGPSLNKTDNSNIINKRFGVYPTMTDLYSFYQGALGCFSRWLKQNGFLIFKCQDCISSGKQYLSHVYIINWAYEFFDFYPKDLFVLLAKNRLVANWQRNQQHARKFHSYFLVLQKR